ncbi:MAG: hypothetical protein HY332_22510 [Chloroflexi bacterium]|nr:hypothetical protein [Chloroflexota bacterium]
MIAETNLPGTALLTETGDLAARMVAGLSSLLDRELAAADAAAAVALASTVTSEQHAEASAKKRQQLARIIGAVDRRLPIDGLEFAGSTAVPALVASAPEYDVYAVRWPVLDGVDGEGLLLQPKAAPVARVVALPDAGWSPEQLAGLAPGVPWEAQFARRLAEKGCQVVVPALIDRGDEWSGNPAIKMTNQPHREFVYRMAFQMGRHIIGYEVQKVLALIDLFARGLPLPLGDGTTTPIGIYGYGEGGLTALYAGALDPRLSVVGVSEHFRNRRELWREPIYRNVWRLLRGFSDAELAAMIAPRALVVEAVPGSRVEGPPPARERRQGAAPGILEPAPLEQVRAEVVRARRVYDALGSSERLVLVEPDGEEDAGPGMEAALRAFVGLLAPHPPAPSPTGGEGEWSLRRSTVRRPTTVPPRPLWVRGFGGEGEEAARSRRQFEQLCRYTQMLMHRSWRQRQAFWAEADTSSLETWRKSCQAYRTYFWDEVIGRTPEPSVPPSPRTRLAYERPSWTRYEVTLDVWPDVFAYGILLVPKGLPPGERRPVVVCQHGLEGRPQDVIEKEGGPYHQFAARLAERGYVVYAPQNPYIGRDDFRVLQRKANPLGWSLFSFIVAQHERTLEWLAALPFVDPERIAFYGLSYGGKTAMRLPALLDRYCLSICSGDFNEWIVKCVSTDLPMSYMFTGEYEMFEFDLGHTFNYAEMAYLIAPRPFMVERGHRDGVGLDEWVAFEYAKVRRRYADLRIPELTEIAFFEGGHKIDGTATFAFLDRHLRWQSQMEDERRTTK